jgi:hypothetical protein
MSKNKENKASNSFVFVAGDKSAHFLLTLVVQC